MAPVNLKKKPKPKYPPPLPQGPTATEPKPSARRLDPAQKPNPKPKPKSTKSPTPITPTNPKPASPKTQTQFLTLFYSQFLSPALVNFQFLTNLPNPTTNQTIDLSSVNSWSVHIYILIRVSSIALNILIALFLIFRSSYYPSTLAKSPWRLDYSQAAGSQLLRRMATSPVAEDLRACPTIEEEEQKQLKLNAKCLTAEQFEVETIIKTKSNSKCYVQAEVTIKNNCSQFPKGNKAPDDNFHVIFPSSITIYVYIYENYIKYVRADKYTKYVYVQLQMLCSSEYSFRQRKTDTDNGYYVYITSRLSKGSLVRADKRGITFRAKSFTASWYPGPKVTVVGNQQGVSVRTTNSSDFPCIQWKHDPNG